MKRKRIAVITPARFPGTAGDTANYTEIINQLILEGYEVTLICPKVSKSKAEGEFSLPNLQIKRVPYIPPRLDDLKNGISLRHYIQLLGFLLAESAKILEVIFKLKIRSAYMRHSLLTMQVPILLRLCRIKVIADGELFSESMEKNIKSRSSNTTFFLRILCSYEQRVINLYTYFKVSTHHQAEHLEEIGFPSKKILLIPMSINTDNIPKPPIEQIPEHTFGYFGALEPWQGLDLLLTSFQLLLKKRPNAILYVIGDGSMRKTLEDKIRKENLVNNIILVGSLSRDRIWNAYFGKFRILVIPRPRLGNSLDTLPSIKLIEGLAAGKAIITTDIPAMKEVPMDSIVMVPAGDPSSLARAMEHLSDDRCKLQDYSSAALHTASNFDIRNNIKKLTSVLEEGNHH